MIWLIRYQIGVLIVALVCSDVVTALLPNSTEFNEEAMNLRSDDVPDVRRNESSGDEAVVGQSLIPGMGGGFGGMGGSPLSLFGWLFPALSSIATWGSGFPAQQMLGAAFDPKQASDSKVVLYLADDPDNQAGASSPFKSITRNPRQNESPQTTQITDSSPIFQFLNAPGLRNLDLSQSGLQQYQTSLLQTLQNPDSSQIIGNLNQSLNQYVPTDLQATVGQSLQQYQSMTQNPGQILAQFLPQNQEGGSQLDQLLSQNPLNQFWSQGQGGAGQSLVGQMFSQSQSQFAQNPSQILAQAFRGSNLDISQLIPGFSQSVPSVGATGPQSTDTESTVPQSAPEPSPSSSPESDPPTATAPATSPVPTSSQSGTSPPLINLQYALSNFERTSDIVGQALNRAQSTIKNFPAFGDLQTVSVDNSQTQAAASEVSEVRVKPDVPQPSNNMDHTIKPTPAEKLSEMKMMSALQDSLRHKTTPILWFRLPSQQFSARTNTEPKTQIDKSDNDVQLEMKLQAFERQVISELRQLQEIERQAKEMRAAAKGVNTKSLKDSPYKLSYPLSKTPVHKITREDIERALNDEYVKKLLMKIARGQNKSPDKSTETYKKYITTMSGGMPTKRQAMMNESGAPTSMPMTKEDIVKMMAYAYRMANVNDEITPWMKEEAKNAKDSKMYATIRANVDQALDADEHNSSAKMKMQRQWADTTTTTTTKEQPTVEQRQWADIMPHNMGQNQQMQRQWSEDHHKQEQPMPTAAVKPQLQQQHQTSEQRQWTEQQQQQEKQHMVEQWVEDKMKQQQLAEQMMRSGQNEMAQMAGKDMEQQRQWAENQQHQQQSSQQSPKMGSSQSLEQQPMKMPMVELQQRQWIEQLQQQQKMPQNAPRQWTDMPPQAQQQQPQTQEQRKMMESTMSDMQPHMQRQMMQTTMSDMMQQTQPQTPALPHQMDNIDSMKMQRSHNVETQQPQSFVAATPQIPENTEKARARGLFDDILEFGGLKSKNSKTRPQTVLNYYYSSGGSRYPVYGGSSSGSYGGGSNSYGGGAGSYGGGSGSYGGGAGSYGGGYGSYGGGAGSYGGGSGSYGGGAAGYGGGSSSYSGDAGSYGGGAGSYGGGSGSYGGYDGSSYGTSYGGGGAGSNAYGGSGAYRTATGDEEIEAMLRQHHILPATHFRK